MKKAENSKQTETQALNIPVVSNCDFRIKEFRGEFEIQKKVIEHKGLWWWKRTDEYWKAIDIFGIPMYYVSLSFGMSISNHKLRNPTYKTLEEAKTALQQIINGATYHSC